MMLSSSRVRASTGVTARQLDYWCRSGLVRCVGAETPGSGHYREFTELEARFVGVLVRVAALGRANQSPVDLLRDQGDDLRELMADGVAWAFVDSDGEVTAAAMPDPVATGIVVALA